jgi:Cu(I)/Ag(I) efflux system membrane fusion protein
MNKINKIALLVAVAVSIAAGGYWLGKNQDRDRKGLPRTTNETNTELLREGSRIEDVATKDSAQRKPLFYRNPMGLPDTSPVPKKDAMGMDYVAVYEGDAPKDDGAISISVAKVQKLGVKSEAAALRSLNKTIHASGRIEIDERRSYAIVPKFEGWVEHLYVNSTGQTVAKGQALFDVYSPELVSAQREYALAKQGETALADADNEAKNSMKQLSAASLARLKNWDMGAADKGKSARNLTFVSPVSGIVMEKKALQGMRFMPGDVLYQIADLSVVWVLAEVNEQDIGQIKVGSHAAISLAAYPDKQFDGKIAFVYPTLNPATRSVQVRVEIDNARGLLKPAMFARVSLAVGNNAQVLSVPTSAVIDSGTRQIVLVQLAEGRFEPRTVKLGSRSDEYVEVLNGISLGENVVTSANFLIDAESNLKAALSGMNQPVANPPVAQSAVPIAVAQDHSAHQAQVKAKEKSASVGHQGVGIVEAINADGTLSISHEAIKSLGWPGMTMDFPLANSSLLTGIKAGSAISFELVERKPDEWVITTLHVQHKEH